MSLFSHTPLRQKLTWLAMTCSIVALVVTAVSLGTYEWVFYRRTMFSHLSTLSAITARNSSAAVAFANADDATRILSALDSEPAVLAAVLYDNQGRRFAAFRRRGADADVTTPAAPPADGMHVTHTVLEIAVPVVETKRFGTLLVVADVSGIRVRLAAYGIVLLCTTLVSGLLAYLLAGWLKERIVAPVQALAAAAVRVRTGADYTVRVAKETDDELGALTDAFNAMLTRIQRNEAEIAQGAERLRIAVESAQIGTWDWDIPGDTIAWNSRNFEIFGVEPGTPLSSALFFAQIHPEDRVRVREAVAAAIDGGVDFLTEFRIHRAARPERTRYVVVRGRFLKSPQGTVQRGVGVTVDVTDRRTAELRVIESELRFRAVAERAPAMIWSCDELLNRDYFNKTWLAFTARTMEQELATGWQEGVPAADLARWKQTVSTAAVQRDPYSVEYRLRRGDGSLRWVVETGSPRLAAGGAFAGYLGSCIDITARKENEEELEDHVRLRTRELEVANQELETFSYSVSHDLRGPVRAIQGFAEIAIEDLDAGNVTDVRDRLDRVVRAADRMNKLIDAFIGMARISRAELTIRPVNLSRIADEIVGFLRSTAPDRPVEVAIAPGMEAAGDERLLRIALENLISNAWKFTSQREDARITVGSEHRRGEKVFFVRDNGAGFEPSRAHKLFHAFERLHSGTEFEGLGVGLSTVHRVITKHHGRIWAESVPGQGATFFFTLPEKPPERVLRDSAGAVAV
ncbi:MAG TPA: ATP-binding protein [Opitutaceae bacterium]|nr:ATP-binding protein [Opitutaceae bacterium]